MADPAVLSLVLAGGEGKRLFKSFLRLPIDAEGNLTVFPIGIHRVWHRWRLSRDPAPEAPWLEPEEDGMKTHLIEAPVRIGQ